MTVAGVVPHMRRPALLPLVFLYVVLLAGASTLQLLKFEDVLTQVPPAVAIAGVAAQVFSLPYLLQIEVGPLARALSYVCALVAPAWWLIIAATKVIVQAGGYWPVFLLVVLAVCGLAWLSVWGIGAPSTRASNPRVRP